MQNKQRTIIILVSIVVFSALIVVMVASSMSVNKQIRESCFSSLEENAELLASDLYSNAMADSAILRSMAAVIASQAELDDGRLLEIIDSFDMPTSNISNIGFLYPDGRLLTQDGASIHA